MLLSSLVIQPPSVRSAVSVMVKWSGACPRAVATATSRGTPSAAATSPAG